MKHKKLIFPIFIILCIGLIIFFVYDRPAAKESKRYNSLKYLLVDEQGIPAMYSKTNGSEKRLFLDINSGVAQDCPVLYTIFMNGKQIKCFWDSNPAVNFRTVLKPNEHKKIEILLKDLTAGENVFQLGTVYFPDKTEWSDPAMLLRDEYSMDLVPFTVLSTNKSGPLLSSSFPYHQGLFVNNSPNAKLFGIEGDLSLYENKGKTGLIYHYNSVNKLYYHWGNTKDITVSLRLSLMKNWEQIPWPDTNTLFLDTKANPDDYLVKEIDLSSSAGEGPNQYIVIAFINPNTSFWYFEEQNKGEDKWKADPHGAQAWATSRNIVIK